MGQQLSTDIRSQLEHRTLEDLLIDDKCVEELQQHLQVLPTSTYKNLSKILALCENTISKDISLGSQPDPPPDPPPEGRNSSPNDSSKWTARLSPLWCIQPEDISVPESIAAILKQADYNPLRQLSKGGVDLQSPGNYYDQTCAVEEARSLNRILYRLLTTFYYDFILELDVTKQLLSKSDGVSHMVEVICKSSKHNPKIVREKVLSWLKVGKRYRRFMDVLCAGCLFLLPEQISDALWERYIPMKGALFDKVIDFLQRLGIVNKCEEEGWNDLSNRILQTLREPFKCHVDFQFQYGQQSRIGDAADSSLIPVARAADEYVEIQDMDVDIAPSSSTIDFRTVKRRKKRTTSRRKQLQSLASAVTARQMPLAEESLPLIEPHQRDYQGRFSRAPTQCEEPPNAPAPCHLAANHQEHCWLLSQTSNNDQGREPLRDISPNATSVNASGTDSAQYMQNVDSSSSSHPRFVSLPRSQVHGPCHVDQRQRVGEVVSDDTLRLERIGNSTINALLNHDDDTPATTFAITQDSIQDSEDRCPQPIWAIQFHKIILQRIVFERPKDIVGGIWFGCPDGLLPSITLRLSKELGNMIRASGQETYINSPSPDAGGIVTSVLLIKLECFRQLIQRDGFGEPFCNQCREEAFVTMQVLDAGLIADFVRSAVRD